MIETTLTEAELAFVGFTKPQTALTGGWRSASGLAAIDLDSLPDEENAALMQALIRIGTDSNADFLG